VLIVEAQPGPRQSIAHLNRRRKFSCARRYSTVAMFSPACLDPVKNNAARGRGRPPGVRPTSLFDPHLNRYYLVGLLDAQAQDSRLGAVAGLEGHDGLFSRAQVHPVQFYVHARQLARQ
jgi:hypothetical protein